MMLQNQSIICFAPSDWWGMNPSCTTHIMKRLAASNKVLYINPFSSDVTGVTKGKRKGLTQRIARKLKSMTKWLKKPLDNLYVFSPLFIPVQGRPWIDRLNNRILIAQIKCACTLAGIKQPLLWIENVRAADLLDSFKDAIKLYHVSDLFGHDGYISRKGIQQKREQEISDAADITVCVSKELYHMKKQTGRNVHYLPHGVDFELFHKVSHDPPVVENIRDIPHPIAGYFGTLTGSNDIALWEYCAEQLPDVHFVLAGRVTGGDYAKLRAMNNVTMPGFIPYEKIPALCANFDVCMLNWKVTPWIRSCNPLKMFEYMAAGKPIVSVAIQEAEQYNDSISIASDKEEYCRLIRWELVNDNPQRQQRRIEAARLNDWQQKVSELSGLIEKMIESQAVV